MSDGFGLDEARRMIGELSAEVASLRQEVTRLRPPAALDDKGEGELSRRRLMGRAVVGLAAAAGGAGLMARPAAAEEEAAGQAVLQGRINNAGAAITTLQGTGESVLLVENSSTDAGPYWSGSAIQARAHAVDKPAISAVHEGDLVEDTPGIGLYAQGATAIRAHAVGDTGTAVLASGGEGTGLRATTLYGPAVDVAAGEVGLSVRAGFLAIGATSDLQALYLENTEPASDSVPYPLARFVNVRSDPGLHLTGSNPSSTSTGADISVQAGKAVLATSARGVGVIAKGGSAPIQLVPQATVGSPTSGFHRRGELLVDQNGALFFCTTKGTPGTWKQVVLA